MKKIIIAVAIAASMLGASVTAADARPWHHGRDWGRHHERHCGGWGWRHHHERFCRHWM